MSQRKLTSLKKHTDLDTLKTLAQQRRIHLLLFTNDHGHELVAASLHHFQFIC